MARASALAAITVAVVSTLCRSARGESDVSAARADYEVGAAAYDRRDYATAARHFNLADERVPNPRALHLAMAACFHLDEPALAMNLVERAESRAVDGSLAELAKRLRRRFGAAASRVRVTCPAGVRCHAAIDGDEFDPALARWVAPGTHQVTVRGAGGGSVSVEVRAAPGATTSVSPTADDLAGATADERIERPRVAPPPAAVEAAPRRLSPVFFWSGVGLTGVAAGIATFLTIESGNRRDDFLANRSPETAEAGEAAQTRAAIGWIVAGGLLVSTVVVALLTDFKGASSRGTAASSPLVRWSP